jgi:hypothetical protein
MERRRRRRGRRGRRGRRRRDLAARVPAKRVSSGRVKEEEKTAASREDGRGEALEALGLGVGQWAEWAEWSSGGVGCALLRQERPGAGDPGACLALLACWLAASR